MSSNTRFGDGFDDNDDDGGVGMEVGGDNDGEEEEEDDDGFFNFKNTAATARGGKWMMGGFILFATYCVKCSQDVRAIHIPVMIRIRVLSESQDCENPKIVS